MRLSFPNTRVGILGGGQLGKMLCEAAAPWHLPVWILDKNAGMSAAHYAHRFVEGDFQRFEDVVQFGKQVDVLTIEIEHVNTEALLALKKEGLTIHPDPEKLQIIQDKGRQKMFYRVNGLPTAPFELFEDAAAIQSKLAGGELHYPFVQKTRKAGYDGKGVKVFRGKQDELLKGPSLVEPLVHIEKEIAVIAARRPSGQVVTFPPVEMVFHPEANLVEMLLSPARISAEQVQAAEALARRTIEAFDICGLLAVEMFLTLTGDLLINEVAPRPHNSGHHTIEGNATSQFEQHLRAVLDLPLGDTHVVRPAAMVNILGAEGNNGPAFYRDIQAALEIEEVYPHIYGKAHTRPFRKMGHFTVTGADVESVLQKARKVEPLAKVYTEG